MIVRALYSKVSGRDFLYQLRICMKHLGFESCLDNPNVYMRFYTRAYGMNYYEYVILYVEDFLVISEKAEYILQKEIEP